MGGNGRQWATGREATGREATVREATDREATDREATDREATDRGATVRVAKEATDRGHRITNPPIIGFWSRRQSRSEANVCLPLFGFAKRVHTLDIDHYDTCAVLYCALKHHC